MGTVTSCFAVAALTGNVLLLFRQAKRAPPRSERCEMVNEDGGLIMGRPGESTSRNGSDARLRPGEDAFDNGARASGADRISSKRQPRRKSGLKPEARLARAVARDGLDSTNPVADARRPATQS